MILVHGGVGPELTWEMQEPLAERWTLIVPWRRGFPPSPSVKRQDFVLDARDLYDMLAEEGSAQATRLGAARERVPGAGHAVPRAAGFNDRLEAFLERGERRRGAV